MSSESERTLSLEDLLQRNMPQPLPPEQDPAGPNWAELSAALEAMGELLAEQNLTLEELAGRTYRGPTQEQVTDLLQETKAIRSLLEQAGKKKERRFSLPHISLPRPSWAWLALPAILVGLAVLWYSSVTILRALGM